MEAGDEDKADDDGDGVGDVLRGHATADPLKQRLDQVGQARLTDPPKGEAGKGDAKLRRRDVVIQVGRLLLDDAREPIALRHQLLDPGCANLDQRELRRDEKAVGAHQREDRQHAEK